jgi:hypothetical protein
MQGISPYVKRSTHVLTFFYEPVNGITVTAKRDQVTPDLHPEYMRGNIRGQARQMKVLADAVKRGPIPPNTDPGAVAMLGYWSEQAAWSDNSGYALTSTDPVFGKYLAQFLPKFFPITGGGVPGSSSYKGNGWLEQGPNEWVWNDASYGIGD